MLNFEFVVEENDICISVDCTTHLLNIKSPTVSDEKWSIVIVKFVKRAMRAKVFYKKKYLMGCSEITITEYLCHSRTKLLAFARDAISFRCSWTDQG